MKHLHQVICTDSIGNGSFDCPAERPYHTGTSWAPRLEAAKMWFGVDQATLDFGVRGKGVTVAILDTGIDPNHPALAGRLVEFKDFVDLTNSTACDPVGHGTAVASIVAGNDPAIGYTGVAPGARIVAIRVIGPGSTPINIVDGINYVIQNKDRLGIKVMNLSLGIVGSVEQFRGKVIPSDGKDVMSQALNRAADAGIIPVVAAGNLLESQKILGQFFSQKGTVGSPGAADKAITIGSMAEPGRRDPATGLTEGAFALSLFSERGPTTDGRIKPDLVAPGERMVVAVLGGGYNAKSGTSFASPFIAGIVALMVEASPNLTPARAKSILKGTAEDWGPASEDIDYGSGRVDAHAALQQVTGKQGSPPPTLGHLRAQGTIDQVRFMDEYEFQVSDPSFRIGVTMIQPNWTSFTEGPQLDVRVVSPSSKPSAESTHRLRQDTLTVVPDVPGTYRLQVIGTSGIEPGTAYFVDVSGGIVGSLNLTRRGVPREPGEAAGLETYEPAISRDNPDFGLASPP